MFSMLVVLTSWIASKMFGSTGQGSGTGDPIDPPAPPPPPKTDPAKSEQVFTQADLDNVAGRTRAEERRKAEQAVAEQLGVPIDEAKDIIEAKRQVDDAQKTEAQRAREEADREKETAKAVIAAAAEEKKAAKAERALMAAGVDVAKLGRATTLLLADVSDIEDAEKLKTSVESLKTDVPSLFGVAPPPGAPSSDPAGQPPAGGNGGTPKGMDAGRERARKEMERDTKSDDPFAGMSMIGGSK